ncbi:PP2C family protein-serine/threonine phosphatase [Cellulomonas sp. ATA003]|uniref:PP2C family protein-serine/threonine phosphatase n=1 Tax=Cellulomonas sp. ATA003 TaxID=3073064 RepID=UPI002873CEBB|nr:PP2C family protein-serine/threonine phosphatase [Cellulomonas sp. ATA003]WNB85721.1 PP2C family protein-serine/threonine phosphatase [Cellulomonas sp. ATA003]
MLVSGVVEPCERLGGDVFDYALSPGALDLAIFDGTGHDLHAGVIATVALAAYRSARRDGHGLIGQAQVVHDTLVEEFGVGALATGVVARLDLATGDLRYVSAGHPYPVVLRSGRPVRTLCGGRRTLLGLDAPLSVVVAHERLEPEDLLVLYTDGMTDARDPGGHPLGLDGLTELLSREMTATTPLPEVARRTARAVADRSGGELGDDATLLLAHWTRRGQANVDTGGR